MGDNCGVLHYGDNFRVLHYGGQLWNGMQSAPGHTSMDRECLLSSS